MVTLDNTLGTIHLKKKSFTGDITSRVQGNCVRIKMKLMWNVFHFFLKQYNTFEIAKHVFQQDFLFETRILISCSGQQKTLQSFEFRHPSLAY